MSEHIALGAFWPGFLLGELQVQADRVLARLRPDPQVALI